MKFRRSLYFVKDMTAGELITEDCIQSVRPGFGLAPKFLMDVIGKRVISNIKSKMPVKRQNIE